MTTEPTERGAREAPEDVEHYRDYEEGAQDSGERGAEAPAEDAAEQDAYIAPPPRDEPPEGDPDSGAEADRAEQGRVVELDEDDYR